MSTHEERSGSGGGQDGGGFYFTPSEEAGATYDAQGHDPDYGFTEDEEAYPGLKQQPGTTMAVPVSAYGVDAEYDYADARQPAAWHGGADFGLLVLRLVVGGTFVAHGLQQLFGLFHGVGRTGLMHALTGAGYSHANILVWVTGGAELGGGALLVLGMFTQIGAAAMLGVLINVIVLKWKLGFFAPGYEYELMAAATTVALMFAGPGRVSIDRPTPWYRHPASFGFTMLVISVGLAVAVLVVWHK